MDAASDLLVVVFRELSCNEQDNMQEDVLRQAEKQTNTGLLMPACPALHSIRVATATKRRVQKLYLPF